MASAVEVEDELLALALQREFEDLEQEYVLDQALALSLYDTEVQLVLSDGGEAAEAPVQAQPDAKPPPMCASCMEPAACKRTRRVLPCGHLYCRECLTTRCRMGLRDRALVPAQCCRKEFPIDFVAEVLSAEELATYETYMGEQAWDTRGLLSDAEYAATVQSFGWRQCPGCGVGVERVTGCSYVRCLRQHAFCFDCGAKWKTCGCANPGH